MYRTLLDGVRYIAFSMRTNSILTPKQGAVFSRYSLFSPNSKISRMRLRQSSMSHLGVEVAPQMPTLPTSPWNHSGRMSSGLSTWYVAGLTLRQASQSTRPLLLFCPQTKMTTSWRAAKALTLGRRLATWRQMVSK